MRNAPCPCGSGTKFKRCCDAYHRGRVPQTPEALMRARYSAYATGAVDFVIKTTHPDSPHYEADARQWRRGLLAFTTATTFASLSVKSNELAQDGSRGWVTFVAELYIDGKDATMKERSLFVRDNERWWYVADDTE